MGTRADFYFGIGERAEWLGSVGWDGNEWSEAGTPLLLAKDEGSFRQEVETILSTRGDATRPEEGWPWPWDDSRLTDYSYCYHEGSVAMFVFGIPEGSDQENEEPFPDMRERQNVKISGPQSGLLLVSW